jgi:ABC-type multidrug transport system ATPase subunit
MIHISGLTKTFGGFTAVRDLSLEIMRGEVFAFLGPNGSGKTTTLKCLVGLVAPDSGTIRVDGIDIGEAPRRARELMSYLPQRVAFHDNLTAREVLAFYCRIRKAPLDRIDQVLAGTRFNFNGFADKPVGTLSGGMIQRLGLAIACLPDAPVLILDEPMVNLDPEGAILFSEFLLSLKEKNRTVILSSHILGDVEQLADRVAILLDGRRVALETIETLLESVTEQARMRLSMANPDDRWRNAALAAGADAAVSNGDSLVIVSSPANRLKILRSIEADGGVISRFATLEPSLEDIYLRYIRDKRASANPKV